MSDKPIPKLPKVAVWDQIGADVSKASNLETILREAKLNWLVTTEPTYFKTGSNSFAQNGEFKFTVRTDMAEKDPERILGCVRGRYHPVQNSDALRMVDDLIKDGFKVERAGVLRNGRKVWLVGSLPEKLQVLDDIILRKISIFTSHDGSSSVQVLATPMRLICSNGMAVPVSGMDVKLQIRHTEGSKKTISDAQKAFKFAGAYFTAFHEQMKLMSSSGISRAQVEKVLEALMPPPAEGARKGKGENARNKILQLWEGSQIGGQQVAVKGTKYGLFSAITQYIEEDRPTRQGKNENVLEARFESVVLGSGTWMRQKAVALLT